MLLTQLSSADLNLYVGQLTPQQKSSPAVQHALSVQRAISMGNYHALFDLYLNAPNMGAYIMDHFIDRERVRALMIMTKACVPLLFVLSPIITQPPIDPLTEHLSPMTSKQVHDSAIDVHLERARVRYPRAGQGVSDGASCRGLQEPKQFGR